MIEPEQRLTPGMQIADYYLQNILFEGPTTRTWLANQVSVNREVIIDSLNRAVQGDDAVVSTFLSDVRTKARVDHPLIGSVFEAVRQEQICFYAREKLGGQTLEEMQLAGKQLTPQEVVHIIKQVAEANLYLENNKIASLALTANQVYVSDTGMCRIVNMAVGGKRDHAVSTHDKQMLGNALVAMLKQGEPGATRTGSLLAYMTDVEREIPLTWEQVHELSAGVERQLSEPQEPLDLQSPTMQLKEKNWSKIGLITGGVAVGVILAVIAGKLFFGSDDPPEERNLDGMVKVSYVDPNNKSKVLDMWVDAHEVTIAEYAAFLDSIQGLDAKALEKIQDRDQPASKVSHKPTDWDAMYEAAKTGGTWNGQKMSLNCPVVGVDWWDAHAYAEFNHRRLPTLEEWSAIIRHGDDTVLIGSNWGEVDQEGDDMTPTGIYGLAGNVREWTRKLTKPAHNPTKRMPIICGGSYLSPQKADYKEWVDTSSSKYSGMSLQDARDLRQPDLGFRTVGSSGSN